MRKRLIVALAGVTAVIVAAAIVLRPAPSPPPVRALGAALEPGLTPAQLRAEVLEPRFERLKPLHRPAPPVLTGSWLESYPEPGETFAAYADAGPTRPTAERRILYFQPIGTFSPEQLRVVEQTADYVARFFQLPVTTLPTLPSSTVPASGRRRHQLLTTYILETVLTPKVPADAIAVLGLTAEDLYPGEGWNFVFGEASIVDRVGVWSIHRYGRPGDPIYLRRTLNTAVHELGHMLSLNHCVGWACVMAGSNSLEESDTAPASLCPTCLQKVTYNVGLDPAKRAAQLAEFFADAGLDAERTAAEKERAALAP